MARLAPLDNIGCSGTLLSENGKIHIDRLDAMALFAAAVEHGSFSAASRRLGIPLATLSRQIAELEAHLGTPLLVRSTRKPALTEAGAGFLGASRRILEQVEEAERVAAGEWQAPRGELVVTAPALFGRLHVLPIVTAFLVQYPAIDVRLLLADRNLDLSEHHVDLAVRIGALPESALHAASVGHVRRVVAASPEVLERHGVPTDPRALASLPTIAFEGLDTARRWIFHDPDRAEPLHVPLRPRLSVSTIEAAVDAAVAGLGFVQVLSYQCAAAVRAGTLRRVLDRYDGAAVPVSLLHRGRDRLPSKTSAFLDFAGGRLRAALREPSAQTLP